MKKKNIYNLITLFCLFSLFSPSFYLFSAYKPAGKRPLSYEKGPVTPRPGQKRISTKPSKKPVPKPSESAFKSTLEPIQESPRELEEENETDKLEQPEEKDINLTSSTKNVQASPITTTGWLFNAYMAGMPLILVSLDKALGTGIAASTKSIIKQFMTRKAFGDIKEETLEQMYRTAHAIDATSDPKTKQALEISLSKQANEFNQMEKSTALSSILSQAAYIGMLNTVAPLFATIFGIGAKIALQSFMPNDQ